MYIKRGENCRCRTPEPKVRGSNPLGDICGFFLFCIKRCGDVLEDFLFFIKYQSGFVGPLPVYLRSRFR